MRQRLNLERLARILAASRVSQNHWAIRLGLSRGHWSDIVNGRHSFPSAKTRQRMLEVFGVRAEELFEPVSEARTDELDFRIALAPRYELTTELGQGGMGTVFLANDRALGRLVALKVVSAEAASGVGSDQLLQEITLVSRLTHPNILPLFDAGERAGSPYYVMPYIRGGSLGALLHSRGRLPLDETLALVDGIAAGLGHAHEHRVLHCDVKPENILVQDGHPWVMDFGIARKLHSEANEWVAVRKELDFSAGTPAYVSPEQASGDAELDARSDVYSLACVVYEMLAGRAPFSGSTTQEIVSRRFSELPPPLRRFAPDVPVAVENVLRRAMSLDPVERPESAAALASALRQAAAGAGSAPIRAAVAAGAARARRWLRPAASSRSTGADSLRPAMKRRDSFASFQRDLVHALRQRRRTPGLTTVAILTLALGIGLTTAVYALVNGVLLRSLPFPEPERLVVLQSVDSAGRSISRVSATNWFDWKEGNRTLTSAALYSVDRSSVVAGREAMRVSSVWVSPELFEVLGTGFLIGRTFDPDEVLRNAGGVIVSEGFWRRHLGASRDPGLTLQVDGLPMDVIGVVREDQVFPEGAEIWTAYRHRPQSRNNINWYAVGRLAPGVTPAQAQGDLSAVARRILESEPATLYSYGVHVVPLHDWLVGDSTSLLLLLMGSAALVLLIACVNLASTNLARGTQQLREMAVRAALGATGQRLVRQVLVDHVLVALVGGAAGALLAWGLVRGVAFMASSHLPRTAEIGIDWRVLLVAFVVSSVAGLLTGILPALQAARAAPNNAIGGGTRGSVAGGRGLPGRMLVGAEIAMALMLVTGAGLLVQSLRSVLARPLGFETEGVVTARVFLGGPRYARDTDAAMAYWRNLLGGLREIPGIQGASLANWVPLVRGGTGFIEIAGRDIPGAGAGYRVISDGYFETLGMSLIAGRSFDERDATDGPRVVVINRMMAERFWPGASPLGGQVRALSMEFGVAGAPPPWLTVIGVVNDVRHFGYESDPAPEMFVLYRQLAPTMPFRVRELTALVRGNGSAERLIGAVRERLASVDPTIPADIGFLRTEAARVTASRRFVMSVMSAFGGLSLLLAGIGIYGVLSFSVARRTRELAVRAALGADRASLLSLIIRSGATVVVAGAAAGLIGAYFLSRLMSNQLYEVSPRDPWVLATATLMVATVGLIATIIPARRATRADPMVALREE
jgi:predicted permease